MKWQCVIGMVVQGHRVASGLNRDARFPGGTLAMQRPHFADRGLDLDGMHSGTLNLDISPSNYQIVSPRWTFPLVTWHPAEPPETFSFIDARVTTTSGSSAEGWVYYPHPETKPEHFQRPGVVELLMPHLPDVAYGDRLELWLPVTQMRLLS